MNKNILALPLMALYLHAGPTISADAIDVPNYLRQHGWTPADARSQPPATPTGEVVPIVFYDKGNSVPSCGVLTAAPRGQAPGFIELVGSDPGVGFPQCLGIGAIKAFRMRNRDYVAIEYLSRETREDTDRGFHYLVRDAARGFVTDVPLTEAIPVVPAAEGGTKPAQARGATAVRQARIAALGSASTGWQVVERDFISGEASSFAILDDRRTKRCQFVTEAGAAPVVVAHTEFAPAATCESVLASSRYENDGKVYYLAMFRTGDGKHVVGTTSVAADGGIRVEKALADSINGNGATKDMKTAKAALASALR